MQKNIWIANICPNSFICGTERNTHKKKKKKKIARVWIIDITFFYHLVTWGELLFLAKDLDKSSTKVGKKGKEINCPKLLTGIEEERERETRNEGAILLPHTSPILSRLTWDCNHSRWSVFSWLRTPSLTCWQSSSAFSNAASKLDLSKWFSGVYFKICHERRNEITWLELTTNIKTGKHFNENKIININNNNRRDLEQELIKKLKAKRFLKHI